MIDAAEANGIHPRSRGFLGENPIAAKEDRARSFESPY